MIRAHKTQPSDISTAARCTLDVQKIRREFPALLQEVHGKPLVYFDNAATTQKPQLVIDTLNQYYTSENANIHRGVHYLSEQATRTYESTRHKIKEFLNAPEAREIIFVRGTTEAVNLVAWSYGRKHINKDDEIIISAIEHHSNIVPWQILCEEIGAILRIIPVDDDGQLIINEYRRLLNARTKLVSVVHVSNALGTINPIRQIIELAHQRGIPVFVDGAQAVPHMKVDVQELNCDFYAFSGHKVFAPTGIGVLYGRAELLEGMPPYQGGGDMILSVSFEKTVYNKLPHKFEAGTPHIAGVIGLGSAIDYVSEIGLEKIATYESGLLDYATQALCSVPGLRMIGTAKEKASVLSFVLDGVHAHDVGTILDNEGIAVRAGHHCAMPIMQRFGVPATARASLAFYNTREEIDRLVEAVYKVKEVFS